MGEKIKKKRKFVKLSQNELADLLGVSYMTVRRWEANLRAPNSELLPQLAKVLNTSVEYLMGLDTPEKTIEQPEPSSPVADPTFAIKKADIVGNKDVIFYEENGKCFSLPATPENEKWFREFLNSKM